MGRSCCIWSVVGLALLAVHCVGAGSAMATIPTLTHEWNFDGNLNDSVGTKTADALGTGTAISGTGGIAGGAATFDGINDLLYVQGRDAIPQGPFTLSFWEYCQSASNQGYYVSDAAVHPEHQWESFMFRRREFLTGGVTSIKSFAETGLKSVYFGNWWVTGGDPDDRYWDPRYAEVSSDCYWDPRLFPDLPTGEWVHHVITYYQPGVTTGGAWGEWYVNGQLSTWQRHPDPFTGLQPLEVDPITDPSDPAYFPNRREGFVIGNLIDNTNIDNYNENYVDNPRIGPTGNYYGKIDEFQIYNGAVTPDMVRYLHNNPSANLTTYSAPAASAQPKGAHLYRWKFDGNLNGELVTSEGTTASYNGAAIGNAAAGASGGRVGGAVYFDGDNDAVQINKNVLTDGAFSLVFWTKEQLLGSGTQKCAIITEGKRPTDDADLNLRLVSYYEQWGDPPPSNFRNFAGYVSRCDVGQFGQDGMAETVTWSYNQWYQHAFVVSPDGDARWYVNNQLMTETPAFPFEGLLNDLFLGNRSDLAYDFKGWIDDLQIYNWDINATDVAFLWNNPGSALTITGGSPVYQPYDVNEDGFVGADDLDVVRAHWGESGPGGKAIGDINLDEFVGADDLDQLRAHWGEVCPPVPGLVPEPSTFVLLLMGAVALIAVRRVR